MYTNANISCVLPAHNEQDSISQVIEEIDAEIGAKTNLEIIVSEDGSVDNTRKIVEELMAKVTNSKLILTEPTSRLGYSRGVQRGISLANQDLILFMDSDGQFDPNDFWLLLKQWKPGMLVIGYRNPRADNLSRRIFSDSFKLFYQFLGFPKLKDPSSPFLLVEKKLIVDFCKQTWFLNFGFWWEFEARIAAEGIQVIEVPVSHRKRVTGNTQVYKLKSLFKIASTHIFGLIKLRSQLKRFRKVKDSK